jgi:hypothetical protein
VKLVLAWMPGGLGGAGGTGGGAYVPSALEQTQRAHVDLRFGMFIHFGILTYTGSWSEANLDISRSADGAITSWAIHTSTDGVTFTEAASGTWPADTRMKVATFGPAPARHVRLEARAANGTNAAATEIGVGGRY